jgi:hypothetical protein
MSNLRRLNLQLKADQSEGLPPETVSALNKRFRDIEEWMEQMSGLRGTVEIAAQKSRTPSPGKPKQKDLAMSMKNGRIGNVDDPENALDVVNLQYLNKRLECTNLIKILANCQEFEDVAGSSAPGADGSDGADGSGNCGQVTLSDRRFVSTGMTNVFSVEALNEFVYAFGVDGADPTLKIYRIEYDRDLVFVSSFVLTQELRRTTMQGQFIYGANDGAGSSEFFIVDIGKPDAPFEAGSLDVTDAINGLHVQGNKLCLATEGGDVLVNVTDPNNPVLF